MPTRNILHMAIDSILEGEGLGVVVNRVLLVESDAELRALERDAVNNPEAAKKYRRVLQRSGRMTPAVRATYDALDDVLQDMGEVEKWVALANAARAARMSILADRNGRTRVIVTIDAITSRASGPGGLNLPKINWTRVLHARIGSSFRNHEASIATDLTNYRIVPLRDDLALPSINESTTTQGGTSLDSNKSPDEAAKTDKKSHSPDKGLMGKGVIHALHTAYQTDDCAVKFPPNTQKYIKCREKTDKTESTGSDLDAARNAWEISGAESDLERYVALLHRSGKLLQAMARARAQSIPLWIGHKQTIRHAFNLYSMGLMKTGRLSQLTSMNQVKRLRVVSAYGPVEVRPIDTWLLQNGWLEYYDDSKDAVEVTTLADEVLHRHDGQFNWLFLNPRARTS